jgi:hypothetical protein
LGLSFRYGWFTSERFGFVRRAWLHSNASTTVRVSLLDGLQNLMPCGVGSQFQVDKSNLLDAYRRNELLAESGLALFRLSSIPIDRPEPAEALRTTTAWSAGLEAGCRLLSSVQLDRFRDGLPVREEQDVRAERGAYFIQAGLTLAPGQKQTWLIAADVDRGPSEVAELNRLLRRHQSLLSTVQADIERGTEELRKIIASADGLQKSEQALSDVRHGANVLFNVMRGGIFEDGYHIDPTDLLSFVRHANRKVASAHIRFFKRLKPNTPYGRLVTLAAGTKDRQLERLCREYLPLTFSRRHGDPSRPWNRFSIASRNPDGKRILSYEGNWRDLFQNWEALAISFPGYLPGMICRFVSASTADGYNPYRVTRDGIDWETIDPSNPWSHIGYWGDHQLIYLLKLLELLQGNDPATLRDLLSRDIFAYANVPYRIKSYHQLLEDPKETVLFDSALHEQVQRRVGSVGADGKLVWDAHDQVRLVNLTEKLLVSVLAKLSNFIPEAGIWMNTQRPEWNDANNALVGYGVSVVTLCYLRRYLAFCVALFSGVEEETFAISVEVSRLLQKVHRVLREHREWLDDPSLDDLKRKQILDVLGLAGSAYRENLYRSGLSGQRTAVQRSTLAGFFKLALDWADHSIAANRRPDHLYHAYNLIQLGRSDAIPIRRLYEMLEGQVAVLSSGRLTAEQSLAVLRALRNSAIYRPDQHSYLLYPNRELPRFTDRNNILRRDINRSPLLQKLLSDGNHALVERDLAGQFHFEGSLTNAGDVKSALDTLAGSGYGTLVRRDAPLIFEIFERLFDHQSFTGRSGTFFGYEGLGSIYWHMVSKLLLAVQETFFRASDQGASQSLVRQLAACYYDVRSGLGDYKTAEQYGAFPTDPYSHTPAHAGARQPGLTGQVKEDILCRIGELGVFVREGRIRFRPELLRLTDFLQEPGEFRYYDVRNTPRRIHLPARSLAFTYCQVPILFRLGSEDRLRIVYADSREEHVPGLSLGSKASRSIFNRDGEIKLLTVWLILEPGNDGLTGL